MGAFSDFPIRRFVAVSLSVAVCTHAALAQQSSPPANAPIGTVANPKRIAPDPRVQQRTYRFAPTGEELPYTVFVSSRVRSNRPAPLIVALHGRGGDSNFIVRDRLVDFAEQGGYIVVGPMGYNVVGFYGAPPIPREGQAILPSNVSELSEEDVMNVLALARAEFNVDPDRIYLLGHSMGGAGVLYLGPKYSDRWAGLAAIAPAAFSLELKRQDIISRIRRARLPVMITQGDDDRSVPVERTRAWARAMNKVGSNFQYIEMAHHDHATVIPDSMPAIFQFFNSRQRRR
jgi:predicted peptidase